MAWLKWEMLHPRVTLDHLGLVPAWLDDRNPKGLCDQMDDGYRFGGFKQYPMDGFKVEREFCLKYPGDPLMRPLAKASLRDEVICFYDAAIFAVFQKDGTFKVARFD